MTGLTHGLAGAVIGAAVARNQGAAIAVGAIAALIPDIDDPRSTLGSKTPVLSAVFKMILGHRGLTHTVLFAVLISGASWALSPYLGLDSATCALTALLAASSHVVLDSLTPGGTEALWPFTGRWAGPIRTGSIVELALTAALGGCLWSLLKGA